MRWASLPEPIGRRPVLLLTRTAAYEYLSNVIVAEVTRTIRGIPQELKLGRREGMRAACVANLDAIHVIPKRTLGDRIGELAPSRIDEVKVAVGHALDWQELKALTAR